MLSNQAYTTLFLFRPDINLTDASGFYQFDQGKKQKSEDCNRSTCPDLTQPAATCVCYENVHFAEGFKNE